MSSRNFWFVAFFWLLLLGGLVTCASVCGGSGAGSSGSAAPDVDLEAVAAEYKRHVAGGAQDLAAFEQAVNERKLYQGTGHVTTAFDETGAVVGFVDGDADAKYSAGKDRLVFKLEADKTRQQLVASDRHDRHFGIGLGEVAGLYLISRMFDRHYGFYGGWHNYGYRSYASPGYYRSWRPSRRSGSSRVFGTRSPSRSSWGGGGWSGGGGFGGGGK